MGPYGEIEVIDEDGWVRKYPLEQTITYIGSDPTNDIALGVGGDRRVAPRHVQLIYLPDTGYGYRLVNLGDTDVQIGSAGDRLLSSRSAMDIDDGETIKLGDFTLMFHLGAGFPGSVVGSSRHIGLSLDLSYGRLAPGQTLQGVITLRNLGDQERVQFELDLEGLPPDCYQIEPAPLLFPGAEEDVRLFLYHRSTQPVAGEHHITIRATAIEAYPGEEATVSRMVRVLPFYEHRLRLLSSHPAEASLPPRPERWWRRILSSRRSRVPSVPTQPPEVEPLLPAEEEPALGPQPAPPSELSVPDRETEAGWPERPERIQPSEAEIRWLKQALAVDFPPSPQREAEEESPVSAEPPSERQEWAASEPPLESSTPASLWVAPEVEFGPPSPLAEGELPSKAEAEPPSDEEPIPSLPAQEVPASEAELISPPQPEETKAPELEAVSQPPSETPPAEVEEVPSLPPAEEEWPAGEPEADQQPPAEEDLWEMAGPTEEIGLPTRTKQVKVVKADAALYWEEAKAKDTSSPREDEDWWESEDDAGRRPDETE